jgi:hypothetical protein
MVGDKHPRAEEILHADIVLTAKVNLTQCKQRRWKRHNAPRAAHGKNL